MNQPHRKKSAAFPAESRNAYAQSAKIIRNRYADRLDADYNRIYDFKIDFDSVSGRIKPLHGINNSPVTAGEVLPELQQAGIPFLRTHDTAGQFGGAHYIDIPNIFPNPEADPESPDSYDFAFTDAYLKGITGSGIKIFYRLGVTIENNWKIKPYHIFPPENPRKFAQVCEHVIRHYNQGWANGFHYGIEYWEIWNEPENPDMWTGSKKEFFEFYRIVANHLKKRFPKLKIGGYGGCGFYGMNRNNPSDFYRSFIFWFEDFLGYISSPKTAAPLDFFSWHLYSHDPIEIALHAEYVRLRLQAYGFSSAENIFNEWNYIDFTNPERWDDMKGMVGATFAAAAFVLLQSSPVDKAMYYDALPSRRYCGIYEFPSRRVTRTYWSFAAFNELYQFGSAVSTEPNPVQGIFLLAAKNRTDSKGKILLVNRRLTGVHCRLNIKGMNRIVRARRIDRLRNLETVPAILPDGSVVLAPVSVTLLDCSAAD